MSREPETKPVILVVDDEPANIDVLRGILMPTYRVKAATSGQKALEIIHSDKPPGLVLLDVMMPQMSGHDVLSALRSGDAQSDIPVIFVTAMSNAGDEARGLELGAADYITKPVSPPLVMARVAAQLRLAEASRQKEELARQLSRYLPPTVWRSLFEGKKVAEVGSHRRKLTVFFSDIVGFTKRTEHLEPEEMTLLLNAYLEAMNRIALKHGGTVDKFIGDAVMVFFGDPETKGEREDADACAHMAVEMQHATAALADAWEFSAEEPFATRMGIATGYCTVGNFGSSERMDYTIIGNTVNLASRLESMAEPGKIMISAETAKLLDGRWSTELRGKVEVKGFEQPVGVYRLDAPEDGRVIKGEGRGYHVRVHLDSLDDGARQELEALIAATSRELSGD